MSAGIPDFAKRVVLFTVGIVALIGMFGLLIGVWLTSFG
jgi:hypothetical protein